MNELTTTEVLDQIQDALRAAKVTKVTRHHGRELHIDGHDFTITARTSSYGHRENTRCTAIVVKCERFLRRGVQAHVTFKPRKDGTINMKGILEALTMLRERLAESKKQEKAEQARLAEIEELKDGTRNMLRILLRDEELFTSGGRLRDAYEADYGGVTLAPQKDGTVEVKLTVPVEKAAEIAMAYGLYCDSCNEHPAAKNTLCRYCAEAQG